MADETLDPLEAARLEKLRQDRGPRARPLGPAVRRPSGDRRRPHSSPSPSDRPRRPGPSVRVAGRIMLRRGQGKVNFLQLRDWTERIQIFIGKNQVGEAGWALAAELDLGDLLGVDGTLGRTKTGELTVFADGLTFLGKSLLPPPEKWHGLTDVEQRSPAALRRPVQQPRVACRRSSAGRRSSRRSARSWPSAGSSRSRRPTMQPIAGGAAARPFVTHHNTLDLDALPADRPRAVPQAAARRRHGAGLRDRPGLSATRGSARSTTPSSPCWRPTRPTATTTA